MPQSEVLGGLRQITEVKVGTELDVGGTISSTVGGSTLDLGSVFINSGTRFNQMTVAGDLALTGSDTLEFGVNPYLLRPNIGLAEEYGSLPLVDVTGNLSGNTITNGTVSISGSAMGGTLDVNGTLTTISGQCEFPAININRSGTRREELMIGEDKLQGYIVDLRNNPGGLLSQAIAVSVRAENCRGGSAPVMGRHSVMLSPLSVNRVSPPTAIIATTSANSTASQTRIAPRAPRRLRSIPPGVGVGCCLLSEETSSKIVRLLILASHLHLAGR